MITTYLNYTFVGDFEGLSKGTSRCQFLLVLSDYLDEQTEFFRHLEPHLERFARKLGKAGDLIRPFTGDIETVRDQVLSKEWTEKERQELKTPCLLMINEPFDSFDPRNHSWIVIHLDHGAGDGVDKARRLGATLERLATAVASRSDDPFEVAHALVYEVTPSEAARVFEAKPGIFGFSIDLAEGVKFVHRLSRRLSRS